MQNKPELKLSSRENGNRGKILTVQEYIDKVWDKYSKYIGKDSDGDPVTKKNFEGVFKSMYASNVSEGKGHSAALKEALKNYQNSGMYFSQEQRVANFTLRDFLQGASKEEIKRFQNLTRDEKGRFTKYNPNNLVYRYSDKIDGTHVTVHTYRNVIILTFNSPDERVFFSKDNIPSEYQKYVVGID